MRAEDNKTTLAWRKHPAPDGTHYTAEDLADERVVEVVFDYCQILEAIVLARGWQYLFETHGLDGLMEINRRSGWFDEVDAEAELIECARRAGYDPVQGGDT